MPEGDPEPWGCCDCPRPQASPWSVAGRICARVLCVPLLLPARPCDQSALPALATALTVPCSLADEQLPDGAGAQGGLAHHVPGSHRLR